MTAQALLDALHEELLVDVRELVTTVAALKSDLPDMTGEVLAGAAEVRAASQKSVEDFLAMGQGLTRALRSQLREERELGSRTVREAAVFTQKALTQFTKYLWVILALAAFNVLLSVALLATR